MTAVAVKQLLPTLQVPNGNSSGKKLSNSLNHDSSCRHKFVCTNFVAQASTDRSSSSCDQVPLSHAFLFVLCRYLEGKNFTRHEKKKSKIKIYEWASILVTEYRPVHSEIATTKPVPKQRHLRLLRSECAPKLQSTEQMHAKWWPPSPHCGST